MGKSFHLKHADVYRVLTISTVAALALALAPANGASAYTFAKLYSLCGKAQCADGQFPYGQLVNVGGTLYGTASTGGKYNGDGDVYALTLKSGQYKYSVIYNFCQNSGCPDGSTPMSDLIADTDGNLYGTAGLGGAHNKGVIFSLTKNGSGWTYTVLYSFCPQSNCPDGDKPVTGLSYQEQASGAAWDGTSPLFGTTSTGGAHGDGVVFELPHNGSNWTYTVLHNSISGQFANAPLVDSASNLFVTSRSGGTHDGGNFYRLDNGTWHETTIHNFCADANCTDGEQPQGRLALDASGNVYGVSYQGGAHSGGVIFERPATGGYSVVYNFCSAANCADGSAGIGLSFAGGGTFFGATQIGGANNGGTIFRLASKNGTLNETVIHDFCGKAHCADGYAPGAAPIEDASGNLFGATVEGGHTNDCPYSGGCGTVFELKK